MKSREIIREYFANLAQILFRPSSFFRKMPLEGGLSEPLAFALVTHWIGTACSFLWRTFFGGTLGDYFKKLLRSDRKNLEIDYLGAHHSAYLSDFKEQIAHWFWGVGPVLTDPFFTLASILFHAGLIFVGVRILVAPGIHDRPAQISYESTVRLICYATAPAILGILPLLGGTLGTFYLFIVTVIAVREVYRIGAFRAMIIALFPKIIFIGIIGFGFIFILAGLMRWLSFFFS